jgi:hypothetical protein
MYLNTSLLLITSLTAAVAQGCAVIPTPTETTVNVFLGAKRENPYSFNASIIAADHVATTYEVRCVSGTLNMPGFPTTTCDRSDPVSCTCFINPIALS